LRHALLPPHPHLLKFGVTKKDKKRLIKIKDVKKKLLARFPINTTPVPGWIIHTNKSLKKYMV